MANLLPAPPSLREFLDSGGDLASFDRVYFLAEVVLLDIPLTPPGELARRAESARESVWRFLAGLDCHTEAVAVSMAALYQWEADVIEKPELRERVRAALPPDIIEELEGKFPLRRRPHPLELRVPENSWWACNNCGVAFEHGEEGLVIGHREGYSTNLGYDVYYCGGCVALAAAVLAGGRG